MTSNDNQKQSGFIGADSLMGVSCAPLTGSQSGGIVMAMRGNKSKQLYMSLSYSRIEIKGHFGITGPQIVGGDGGAPEWVAAALESNPKVQAIAVVTEHGGCVWQRITENA